MYLFWDIYYLPDFGVRTGARENLVIKKINCAIDVE